MYRSSGHKTGRERSLQPPGASLRNRRKAIRTSSIWSRPATWTGFYYKPRIDKDLLARHSKGLIAMSACLRGDINETLLADKYDDAKRLAHEYTDLFGKNNFFLEMQDHGLDQDKSLMPQVHGLRARQGFRWSLPTTRTI